MFLAAAADCLRHNDAFLSGENSDCGDQLFLLSELLWDFGCTKDLGIEV